MIATDEGLIGFLEQFASWSYRWGVGNPGNAGIPYVRSKILSEFLDVSTVVERAGVLVGDPSLGDQPRAILRSLLLDVQAVREGRERSPLQDSD
jgi:hypothetical protein